MDIDQIGPLVAAYGWLSLGPQKNKHMISFKHEESGRRLNIYFTTGTITIQNGVIETHREVDLTTLEGFISREV
jgi:hypothetical protein